MPKRCVLMQPTYLPWLGYFDLIDQADVFVFLDNVQLEQQSWMTRNRIKTANGEVYLIVPIQHTAHYNEMWLHETQICETKPWRKKHLRSIEQAYRKSAHFETVFPLVEAFYAFSGSNLADFNCHVIQQICQAIGLNKPLLRASSLPNIDGRKDDRIAAICNAVGCQEYLSPQGAAAYIEQDTPGGALVKNGLALFYQHYVHPPYRQLYGDFLPYMSVVDLLFNHGFADSLDMIRQGRRDPIDYRAFRTDMMQLPVESPLHTKRSFV